MIDKPLIAYPAFSRVGASPDLLVFWAFLAVTGVDRCGWLEDSFRAEMFIVLLGFRHRSARPRA
jgi:hypothetical protein